MAMRGTRKHEVIQSELLDVVRARGALRDGPTEHPEEMNRVELVAHFRGKAGRTTVLKAIDELVMRGELIRRSVKIGGYWREVYKHRQIDRAYAAVDRIRGKLARHGIQCFYIERDPTLYIRGADDLKDLAALLDRVK